MTRAKANDRYQMKGLLSAIEQVDSILLFSHISPDGDTIGSVLALKKILVRLQKHVIMVLDGMVPANLYFLPDIYGFHKPEDVMTQVKESKQQTLAIAVDVSCPDRMGTGEELFFSATVTAQIDHHETNPAYAQINVIDGSAPSTALLVSRLQEKLGLTIQKDEAICLYTAVATDTGNFVYENTNAEAFLLMSRLMDVGLPLARVSRILFRRKEREFIALLGKSLSTLTFIQKGEIAGMHLSWQDFLATGATNDNADGIVDYAIDTAGVKMAYFARELENGSIKVSLRALSPCRVDTAAALFGGGGHFLAAGCTLHIPLEQAICEIQEALAKTAEGNVSA